jgi:hypothetical protein
MRPLQWQSSNQSEARDPRPKTRVVQRASPLGVPAGKLLTARWASGSLGERLPQLAALSVLAGHNLNTTSYYIAHCIGRYGPAIGNNMASAQSTHPGYC